MKLTHKIKLLPDTAQTRLLKSMFWQFNSACNYVSGMAFESRIFRAFSLHRESYRYLREEFGLQAQLAVRAIGVVANTYADKSKRNTLSKFRPRAAVVLDDRLYSHKAGGISISTLEGRTLIPYKVAKRDRNVAIRGQADLVYQNKSFYLCVVSDVEEPAVIDPETWLGVDMGITNIAATSDGELYSGAGIDKVRTKATALRARLQSCGTRSAKRKFFKVQHRQRRFVRDVNHCVSKQIVAKAKALKSGIAVEDLSRIQTPVRKSERQRLGQWSFYELRQFLEYKARLAGIPVKGVEAAYTSKCCSSCGHTIRSNRKASKFVCKRCGFATHADLNAAINIAARAAVNPPIAPPQGV